MKEEMVAIVKDKKAAKLVVTKRPVPSELKRGEALVKVLATSICGTDYHIYQYDEWSKKRIKPPFIAGHEFSGEVVKLGDGVTHLKIGDLVSAETHIVCGECEFCKRGEAHICQHTKVIGVDGDGCFAEYIRMPATNLIVNDSQMDPKYLSIQE